MQNIVFTIGHSTHSIEKFIRLLKLNRVDAIADVRSSPFSKMNPQYNRKNLYSSLNEVGIHYVFLGKELGARSNDPSCYLNGKIQYHQLANTKLFKSGIERLKEGSATYHVALMCAEKEPLDCHRTILVSRELINHGLEVKHILSDGTLETQESALERLMNSLNIENDDMFLSTDEILNMAYKKQADKIAYVRAENISSTIDHEGDFNSVREN